MPLTDTKAVQGRADFKHGRTAYIRRGCRCSVCSTAASEYSLAYRVRTGRTKYPGLVGSPKRPQSFVDVMERLTQKFTIGDECWEWTGSRATYGYAGFKLNGKTMRAHRLIYMLVNGPIPDGLTIDHLCHVRHCVRPSHLEAVTTTVNTTRAKARQTHCLRGHEYTDADTYVGPTGARRCRVCRRKGGR